MADQPLACRLCGTTRAVLTREHIPPKSAGNAGPYRIRTLRSGSARPNEVNLSDGFSLSVLCDGCNSRFGSRLGTTFAGFVQQMQRSGRFISPRGGVYACAMDIYPSRVLRHLLLNFLCIHPVSDPDRWEVVREYVQSRDGILPPEAPRVGIYYNISNSYRIAPVGVVGALGKGREPWMGAEIVAPGLGVVFTIGDPEEVNPAIMPKLVDISDWGQHNFSSQIRAVMEIPRYQVETPHPLGFGRPKDVEKWQNRNMIAWLATRFDADVGSDLGAALWRPERRRRKKR